MMNPTLPENLIFISAQPDDFYFQWQVEVQIVNFRKHGISDRMHVLVYCPSDRESDKGWNVLVDKYKEVRFSFFKDRGAEIGIYIPVLRPHILKQYFTLYPELSEKVIFYHDADIIFNYLPDFGTLSQGDTCFVSDTSSYLDYSYLKAKEKEGKIEEDLVSKKLAELTGVSLEDIKRYDRSTGNPAGGAQYLLKQIDANFWGEVEEDCIKIRKFLMEDINKTYFPSESAGYQSWCADMWAVNFNLWKRGIETKATPLLDFSWATDHINTYHSKPIYHNAGATSNSRNLFYKGMWHKASPIGKKLAVSQNFASAMYVKAIEEVNVPR